MVYYSIIQRFVCIICPKNFLAIIIYSFIDDIFAFYIPLLQVFQIFCYNIEIALTCKIFSIFVNR